MALERAPLPDACFLGDVKRVVELLQEGHSVNEPDEFGWTPLHRAVESGSVEVLQLLIKCDADPDALTPAESTAFHIAALHGNYEIAEALIEADETPNVNEENVNGSTPVMAAAFNCNPRMTSLLISQGAQVLECDEDGWNSLHFAAWNAGKDGSAEVAELLLEAGIDVTQRISTRHAENDKDLLRNGSTALEIVKRRLVLMSDSERVNGKATAEVLKKWESSKADKLAKVADEKKKRSSLEAAQANALRRTSLAGRRKSSISPQAVNAAKLRRESKASAKEK